MKGRISIIIVLLIALFSISTVHHSRAVANLHEPETGAYDFNAYGFCYVKVKNIKTGKFLYLFTNTVVKHCCGNVNQQNNFIVYVNRAAGEYIYDHMSEPETDFKLLPTFSKCMKTATEAETVRAKKLKYFRSLNYEVVELDMNIEIADHCE